MKTTLLMCKNIASTPRFVFVEKQVRGPEVKQDAQSPIGSPKELVKSTTNSGDLMARHANNDLEALANKEKAPSTPILKNDVDRMLRNRGKIQDDEELSFSDIATDTVDRIIKTNYRKVNSTEMGHGDMYIYTDKGKSIVAIYDETLNDRNNKSKIKLFTIVKSK